MAIDRAWLAQYRALLTRIPAAAMVLPIYTHVKGVTRFADLHAGAFVVTDRNALIPSLFSGDRGQPMKYFRYRNRPYAPSDLWYWSDPAEAVDWPKVACSYDFLLVMKPYEAARIGLRTEVIADNSSATLLAPAKDACRRS